MQWIRSTTTMSSVGEPSSAALERWRTPTPPASTRSQAPTESIHFRAPREAARPSPNFNEQNQRKSKSAQLDQTQSLQIPGDHCISMGKDYKATEDRLSIATTSKELAFADHNDDRIAKTNMHTGIKHTHLIYKQTARASIDKYTDH